jgi:hypothetical protein
MSYSYNQRQKNIKTFKADPTMYLVVDDKKKTFRQINGSWKFVDYIEPVTSSK